MVRSAGGVFHINMTRALTPLATSITRTTLRRSLGLLSLATFFGLAACGGGGDDSSSSGGANGGGSGSGDIVFTGTNNSARTGFTPPTDATTCLAIKTTFIQVNCLSRQSRNQTSNTMASPPPVR